MGEQHELQLIERNIITDLVCAYREENVVSKLVNYIKLADLYIKKAGFYENKDHIHINRYYELSIHLLNNALSFAQKLSNDNIKNNIKFKINLLISDYLHKMKIQTNKLLQEKFIKHCKNQLIKIRAKTNKKIVLLENQVDRIQCSSEISQLYADVNKDLFNLLQACFKYSLNLLEKPKDEYAVVVLGSFALGTATPFSDVEFGILAKKCDDESKHFARVWATLFTFVIANLGETPIRLRCIPALEWLYNRFQREIPNGLSVDGAGTNACKTPIGNLFLRNCILKYELIMTPEEMATLHYIHDEKLEKTHLASALNYTKLIFGSQNLYEEYLASKKIILQKQTVLNGRKVHINQFRALEIMLIEDLKQFKPLLSEFYIVKYDIYRPIVTLVEAMSLFYMISGDSVWSIINNLYKKNIINTFHRDLLLATINIAAYIRLKTYIDNSSQDERLFMTSRFINNSQLTQVKKYASILGSIELMVDFFFKSTMLQALFSKFLTSHDKQKYFLQKRISSFTLESVIDFICFATKKSRLSKDNITVSARNTNALYRDAIDNCLSLKYISDIMEATKKSKLRKFVAPACYLLIAISIHYMQTGKISRAIEEFQKVELIIQKFLSKNIYLNAIYDRWISKRSIFSGEMKKIRHELCDRLLKYDRKLPTVLAQFYYFAGRLYLCGANLEKYGKTTSFYYLQRSISIRNYIDSQPDKCFDDSYNEHRVDSKLPYRNGILQHHSKSCNVKRLQNTMKEYEQLINDDKFNNLECYYRILLIIIRILRIGTDNKLINDLLINAEHIKKVIFQNYDLSKLSRASRYYNIKGWFYLVTNNLLKANSCFRQALSTDHKNNVIDYPSIDALCGLGFISLRKNNQSTALKFYKRSRQLQQYLGISSEHVVADQLENLGRKLHASPCKL